MLLDLLTFVNLPITSRVESVLILFHAFSPLNENRFVNVPNTVQNMEPISAQLSNIFQVSFRESAIGMTANK